MHKPSSLALLTVLSLQVLAPLRSWGRGPDDKDKDKGPVERLPAKMYRFEMAAPSMPSPAMRMGATPGGAKDIGFARDRILAGEIPHPSTFTPEGLFSEYDLPLETGRSCRQVLCLSAAATKVELLALPEARQLGQLGFASNLDAKTWHRERMNIIAVIDKSGSMSGTPIDTVKASLHQVVDQLGAGDQLAIVLYGDKSHEHMQPTELTPVNKKKVHAAIDAIAIAGSTNMEEGLLVGYGVAEKSAVQFQGTTRVMLFTDERPNVGATQKGSFMGMARQASKKGIGLTTVGVGVQFGAELATAISSVRGGNLFFFANVPDMKTKFQKDLDTMLTELAYDMKLVIKPRQGMRIAGLFGIPGDLVKPTPGGGLEMRVETIFLSKDRGGIFLAFAPETGAPPAAAGPAADATVEYVGKDGKHYKDAVSFGPWQGPLPLGLSRGALLVDEFTAMKKATDLHLTKNDQEGAYRLAHALHVRMQQGGAEQLGLGKELKLSAKLDETLTHLSGHRGEPTAAQERDGVTGLPR